MNGKLFCINKNGYPEDWGLEYAEDDLHAVLQFCKDYDIPHISVEDFFNEYEVGEINTIGSKRIKEIIFED